MIMLRALRIGTCAALVALGLGLLTAGTASAQSAGSLDSTFGLNGQGVVTTAGAQLLGVAVQSDGEIVAAGQSGGDVFVERFTTGGAPDGSTPARPESHVRSRSSQAATSSSRGQAAELCSSSASPPA